MPLAAVITACMHSAVGLLMLFSMQQPHQRCHSCLIPFVWISHPDVMGSRHLRMHPSLFALLLFEGAPGDASALTFQFPHSSSCKTRQIIQGATRLRISFEPGHQATRVNVCVDLAASPAFQASCVWGQSSAQTVSSSCLRNPAADEWLTVPLLQLSHTQSSSFQLRLSGNRIVSSVSDCLASNLLFSSLATSSPSYFPLS